MKKRIACTVMLLVFIFSCFIIDTFECKRVCEANTACFKMCMYYDGEK